MQAHGHRRPWVGTVVAAVLALALGASAAAVRAAVTLPPRSSASAGTARAPETGADGQLGAAARRRAPLVVLDPGHGGTNTGARSLVPGIYEKDLTLALAQAVAHRLQRRGIRVVLTRRRDRYVTLRQRVLLANRLGADLLLSIHANATASHSQRGYETWMLTPRALDIDSRALRAEGAARWPGADRRTGLVLDDLARGLSHPGAARLAAAVQAQLAARRGPAGDRGVKQGSMDVLLGADMPAVLVEVGFIDHPVEGRELLDPAVLAGMADALAQAVASQTDAE